MPFSSLTDQALLAEVGRRLSLRRLDQNRTRKEIAVQAGLSITAINNLEKGQGATLLTFLRVCRALDQLDELELGLPEPSPSPLTLLKLQGKPRQRARPHTVKG